MIGNPVNYDKKFKDNFPIFPAKFDPVLKRYLHLIPGKEVLDLGIGQGTDSIPLAELGFNVTGVDYSIKCLEICKNNCNKLNLVHSDIRFFNIEKNKYDLIKSRCVLHFLHKNDIYDIIKNIKNNLKSDGLVYISVFSLEDPSFNFKCNNPDFDTLENNVFHKISDDTYSSYFSKNEILELFSDFNTIFISDEYSLDLGHGTPHYHGIIKYIGKKIK